MDVADFEERIEEYRHKHESGVEWNLRKTFMLTHMDRYPLSRLLCMAACFINYECYGCTYPGPVMVELKELMEDIGDVLEEHRETITKARQIQFIKSSGEESLQQSFPTANTSTHNSNKSSSMRSGTAAKRPAFKSENDDSELVPKKKKKSGDLTKSMAFVKASDSYQSTDVNEEKNAKAATASKKDPWVSSLTSKSGRDPWMSSVTSLGGGIGSFSDEDISEKEETTSHLNRSVEEERSELLDKFYTLKAILPECLRKSNNHPVSALHMAVDKAKLHMTTDITNSTKMKGKFDCLLQIDFVDIANTTGQNKKSAKTSAYEQAIAEFKEPYLKIEKRKDGKQILEGSQAPFSDVGLKPTTMSHVAAKAKLMKSGLTGLTKLGTSTSGNITALAKAHHGTKNFPPPKKWNRQQRPIEEFLIFRHINTEPIATNVLTSSACFNKMSLDYDFRHDTVMGESRVRCLVSLQGTVMAEEEEQTQLAAKHLASQKCMDQLEQICWTLIVKKSADSEDAGLSRDEVLGDIEKASEAIPETNIGSKLLKAMGWKGGGVGKKGTGIAEPVQVDAVVNRAGLGLSSEQGISKNFLESIRTVVESYVQSKKQTDLVFSPDFTKDERAQIHQLCQRYNLRTQSYGSGNERYLTARRKRDANELFNYIMKNGGETSKYKLIPPGGNIVQDDDEY